MNIKSYENMVQLIGKTPMVKLKKIPMTFEAQIYGKLESFNPAGSVKDRVALSIIEDAEAKGLISSGATLIVPTSGNTGLAVAFLSSSRGYKSIITMPDTMSIERVNLLKAYGAEVILTPGDYGMTGSIDRAQRLKDEIPGSFIVDQFDNPANPIIHERTTAVEIWEDTKGNIDAFVCGVGTGGTLTGVGKFLKAKNPEIRIVAVEPYDSCVLSGGPPGPHALQGIGAGFVPKVLDVSLIDQIVKVKNEEAFETCRRLGRKEGLLLGISSGSAVFAAAEYAANSGKQSQNIVVILPDGGQKYMSTPVWS